MTQTREITIPELPEWAGGLTAQYAPTALVWLALGVTYAATRLHRRYPGLKPAAGRAVRAAAARGRHVLTSSPLLMTYLTGIAAGWCKLLGMSEGWPNLSGRHGELMAMYSILTIVPAVACTHTLVERWSTTPPIPPPATPAPAPVESTPKVSMSPAEVQRHMGEIVASVTPWSIPATELILDELKGVPYVQPEPPKPEPPKPEKADPEKGILHEAVEMIRRSGCMTDVTISGWYKSASQPSSSWVRFTGNRADGKEAATLRDNLCRLADRTPSRWTVEGISRTVVLTPDSAKAVLDYFADNPLPGPEPDVFDEAARYLRGTGLFASLAIESRTDAPDRRVFVGPLVPNFESVKFPTLKAGNGLNANDVFHVLVRDIPKLPGCGWRGSSTYNNPRRVSLTRQGAEAVVALCKERGVVPADQ